MQRRLDATVTHLITMETTGVRERIMSHSSIDYFATLSLSVCMKVDFRTEIACFCHAKGKHTPKFRGKIFLQIATKP